MTEPIPIREVNGTRQLRYDYTAQDKAELGQQLSQAIKKQGGLADELSTIKAQYKHREAEIVATVNALANKITTGYEMREVNILTITDLNRGLVIVKRLDTGEVVEERPVLDHERQLIMEVTKDSATDTLQQGMDILAEAGEAAASAPPPAPACDAEHPCCELRGLHRHPGKELECECHCHICDCEPPDAPPGPDEPEPPQENEGGGDQS